MKKKQVAALKLTIERSDVELWGRLIYDDNLLVESAQTLPELEERMRQLLADFHDLDPQSITFQIEYDLTTFFEQFSFLKVTKIAELAGINGSLVRQYVAGKKNPSASQAHKLEEAIRRLGQQLSEVHLSA